MERVMEPNGKAGFEDGREGTEENGKRKGIVYQQTIVTYKHVQRTHECLYVRNTHTDRHTDGHREKENVKLAEGRCIGTVKERKA